MAQANQNSVDRNAELLNQYIQDFVARNRMEGGGTSIVSTTPATQQSIRIPVQNNFTFSRRRTIR